ncbi:MAG: hypothetical protein K2Q33_08100, partial [Gammaproteobacteria bacterium]|nr:hypothetical protein [Gammaproteobacteria bacterium]
MLHYLEVLYDPKDNAMLQTLLAIDQGTSSTRAIIFDSRGHILAQAQIMHEHIKAISDDADVLGRVEQDGETIWHNTISVCKQVLTQTKSENLVAVGISNQRETLVTWDAKT